jgi:hypothetical protein
MRRPVMLLSLSVINLKRTLYNGLLELLKSSLLELSPLARCRGLKLWMSLGALLYGLRVIDASG